MGAEAAHMGAQTRQINQNLQDGQAITAAMQTWAQNPKANTAAVQAAASIVARNPDMAARFPQMVATMGQIAAGNGQLPPSLADTISAGTGAQTFGNTATGQERDLANARATTGMAAAATRYSADAAAGASMTNERVRQAGENARGVTTVLINGVPTVVTNVDAGRLRPQAYDSAVARENVVQGGLTARDLTTVLGGPDGKTPIQVTTTEAGQKHLQHYDAPKAAVIAGNDSKYTPTQDPNSGKTVLKTQVDAANTGVSPTAANVGEVQAREAQKAAEAPPGQTAPGQTPEETSIYRSSLAGGTLGAKPEDISAKDAADMDRLITSHIVAGNPQALGFKSTPDATLMDAIRQQAAYLYSRDPTMRNNMQAAVTQAVINVTGQHGENIRFERAVIPGSGHSSHMVLVDPGKIKYPPGAPRPAGAPALAGASALAATVSGTPPGAPPAAAPPPAAGVSPLAGAVAGTPPTAPAPASAPAPAAAPVPQQQAQAAPPSGLREGQTATGPKGEKWVFHNGQWGPL
jgi:hypothetical protein